MVTHVPVPGIAVAMIKDGKVIYEEGIGHANDSMEVVTENVGNTQLQYLDYSRPF